MVYQANTEDYTDASFSLIKACQCQVQLSKDKNPHIKTLRLPVPFPTFLFMASCQYVRREISGFTAIRLMPVIQTELPKGAK